MATDRPTEEPVTVEEVKAFLRRSKALQGPLIDGHVPYELEAAALTPRLCHALLEAWERLEHAEDAANLEGDEGRRLLEQWCETVNYIRTQREREQLRDATRDHLAGTAPPGEPEALREARRVLSMLAEEATDAPDIAQFSNDILGALTLLGPTPESED